MITAYAQYMFSNVSVKSPCKLCLEDWSETSIRSAAARELFQTSELVVIVNPDYALVHTIGNKTKKYVIARNPPLNWPTAI